MAPAPVSPSCTPTNEECDNRDNDCDGKLDEAVTSDCGVSMIGICHLGKKTCTAGTWSECVGAVNPAMEVCDAGRTDENCDGTANEGCPCTPGEITDCGSSMGICRPGKQTCTPDGQMGTTCTGSIMPKASEECDGTNDDDCDGKTDEGCECTNGATMECPKSTGICEPGTKTCSNGKWSAQCANQKRGTAETCDGIDNDCDGQIDVGASCGIGKACMQGVCGCTSVAGCPPSADVCHVAECNAGTCSMREVFCTAGSACDIAAGGCVPLCGNGRIDPSEECDPKPPAGDTWSCNKETCEITNLGSTAYTKGCANSSVCTRDEVCDSLAFGTGICMAPCTLHVMCTALPPGYTGSCAPEAPESPAGFDHGCLINCSVSSDCPNGLACPGGGGFCLPSVR